MNEEYRDNLEFDELESRINYLLSDITKLNKRLKNQSQEEFNQKFLIRIVTFMNLFFIYDNWVDPEEKYSDTSKIFLTHTNYLKLPLRNLPRRKRRSLFLLRNSYMQ